MKATTLHKLSWDGLEEIRHLPDPDNLHNCSSSILYDDEIRKKRDQWFSYFWVGKETITGDDMLYFHRYTQKNDRENGLIFSRGNQIRMLSVTQPWFTYKRVQFYYLQVSPEETYLRSIPLK